MKKFLKIICATAMFLLAGCGGEPPSGQLLTIRQDLLAYLDMPYQTFQEQGGEEAQVYHANFFTAPVPDTDVTAVFASSQIDQTNVTGLNGTDQVVRLEGPLDELLEGLEQEMSLEALAEQLQGENPSYQIAEGAGTAYYVAERYGVITWYAGEAGGQLQLEIALGPSGEEIGPDACAWLVWQ